MDEVDFQRRFAGVRRLYGDDALTRFNQAHVCVVGIGGVGSWAAEALARNAVGRITLIDLDNIAESNVNRQLHAVDGAFGKAKVTAMAERIRSINPQCEVFELEDFITPENAVTLLANGYDVVLDAIDDAKAKVAIAAYCRLHKQPLVMTGGAGGRLDPVRMQAADLAKPQVTGCWQKSVTSCAVTMVSPSVTRPVSVFPVSIRMSRYTNHIVKIAMRNPRSLALIARVMAHLFVSRHLSAWQLLLWY